MVVEVSVDIRDGVGVFIPVGPGPDNFPKLTYADGDQLRVPDADGTRYQVVFVTQEAPGSEQAYKKIYLRRDAPQFAGTGWGL